MWENLFEKIKNDVNQDDGVIISFFGQFTEMIFKILLLAGVPFLIYLFIQFIQLS